MNPEYTDELDDYLSSIKPYDDDEEDEFNTDDWLKIEIREKNEISKFI